MARAILTIHYSPAVQWNVCVWPDCWGHAEGWLCSFHRRAVPPRLVGFAEIDTWLSANVRGRLGGGNALVVDDQGHERKLSERA